jgi:threonine synthase
VSPDVDWKTAVRQGLAPDGGLYVPTEIPTVRIPKAPVASARSSANSAAHRAAVALSVIHPFFEEMARDDLHALLADALDFEIPLVELGDGIHLLELFHGPTCAFKDVGARCLARWLGWLATAGEPLTVLVATSGDTGSAVAQAFHGVAGTRVVILYPEGKVSPLQEKQFATLGGNVFALAVDGTFDDCQRLVKQAFADDDLRERRRLTSANSINVGRYIPQAFYYPYAAGLLARPDGPVLFSVPSGNFGNLCAGLLAKRMAMPNARFVAATNANDVVPEYLDTGRFRPRASLRTISNAMDVGDPSNFDRILDLYGGDVDAIRADVRGSRHDDESTRAAVRDAFEQTGRILDPHTAVGWLGARDARREFDGPIVVLATAHPAKFREVIEPVIEASVTLPESLRACIELPTRSTPMAADFARFRDWLVSASLESDDA